MSKIIKDMSIEEYHAHPAISKSGLDLVAKSPRHYWYEYLRPERDEREDKTHFVIGQAFHTLVLEPELFNEQFLVWSGKPRNKKAGKEEYAQAQYEANGRSLLKKSEYEDIKQMAKAVREHPGAMRLLNANGQAESSIFWTDPETGIECRCRPDFLRDDGLIVDLKTAHDASHETFMKSAFTHRYDVQSAFYSEGAKQAGITPMGFAYVVVESKKPLCVSTFSTDQDMMMLGEYRMRKDMATFAACLKRNEWPGYSGMIKPLGIPAWGHKILNEGMEGISA